MMMTAVLIGLMDTSKCKASSGTILWRSNGTNIIAYQEDPEMEFQMESETSRRILAQQIFVTSGALRPDQASNCGQPRNRPYRCGGRASGSKPRNCKDIYDRGCIRG
ncbi:hypothetical protein TIFTF001_037676 [Ficus carica]|uniref:Rapid ALkalinization Factor n=1 Tax=Ficus carica TaxID=3494 RepID=A0AA88E7G2_FICCA|nr:hypothetical protein TIFTF001_037676 [Ficus carica]